MKKRWLFIVGCVIAVLLAGYLTLWLTASKDRITPENYAKIRNGIKEGEVEAILGSASMEDEDRDFIVALITMDLRPPLECSHFVGWSGRHHCIIVGFG